MKRTKIICTIGPASDETDTLIKMMQAGMDIARLNFSHGTHAEHSRRVSRIREAAARTGKNIAILLDTRGPEIRLGILEKPVFLKAGEEVVLTTEKVTGNEKILPVNYLPKQISPGNTVLIADGLVELRTIATGPNKVQCLIVNGGEINSQKGVSLPGVPLDLPVLTEQDKQDILFGIEHELDFIALSFVRQADDVLAARQIVQDAGVDLDIIAKIENREGLNNVDEIIEAADGIMVARGDLGVGIPVEEVPLVQKEIIQKCNQAGKPVITATQMLESMVNNPRPTRAEASDVANAILDGTDAIMLSGETAAGHYPVEAVTTMNRIALKVEATLPYDEILYRRGRNLARTITDAISHATCTTARDLQAAAIITSTQTGYTAKMVSKYRPQVPVIAVTPQTRVFRKLTLVWGVYPLLVAPTKDTDSMIDFAIKAALANGLVKSGDLVVITAGVPVGLQGTTNLLKVHMI